jgi:3-hexulose-6-phosphate synthase
MQLQLALDLCTIDEALAMLREVHDLVDITEVGTPMILRDGMAAVSAVRRQHPTMTVLADLKIIDAGEHEAALGVEGGADIITVLGAADDATIRGAVKAAAQHKRMVMADMITIDDVAGRAVELVGLGVDLVCVHTAYDRHVTGADPLEDLMSVAAQLEPRQMAVAGGINEEKLMQVRPYQPAVVVVGGAITSAPDIRQATLRLRRIIDHDCQ